jgi:hypothetical protein
MRDASPSGERPRRGAPLRHSTAARSPNGERARRRGPRAAPPARSLRRRSGARSRRCGASERERRENELGFARGRRSAFLFGRKPRAAVGSRRTAHALRTDYQPRRDSTFPAQAQVAAWSAGRAERERAAGCFFVSGRLAACGGERNPRASGPRANFGFGPSAGRGRGMISREVGRGPISVSGWFPGGRAR